jgi:hypothetical protein
MFLYTECITSAFQQRSAPRTKAVEHGAAGILSEQPELRIVAKDESNYQANPIEPCSSMNPRNTFQDAGEPRNNLNL